MDDEKRKISQVSTAVLAYIGDAVYEQYVRRHVFQKGLLKPDRLHKAAVVYVRAEAQAEAVRQLHDELTDDERSVVRRGRNHKITSMPHNVDINTYKLATGFEALIGYANLSGDTDREHELIKRTFEIIEASEIETKRK